jgi:hypothetical protein
VVDVSSESEDPQEEMSLLTQLLTFMMHGRTVYVARGGVVDTGSAGEPVLSGETITLAPLSRFQRVELPEWLGSAGREFSAAWNEWRRRRWKAGMPAIGVPHKTYLDVLLAAEDEFNPLANLDSYKERRDRIARGYWKVSI